MTNRTAAGMGNGAIQLESKDGLKAVQANPRLSWDTGRGLPSEPSRLSAVKRLFSRAFGITTFSVVDSGQEPGPGWFQGFVVSPTDVAIRTGFSIFGEGLGHAKAYSAMVRALAPQVSGITMGEWIARFLDDGSARLAAGTRDRWLALPRQQQADGPLVVRRMPVNLCARFSCEGVLYSLPPRDVKKLAGRHAPDSPDHFVCGDLVSLFCALVCDPGIAAGIAAGTAPRVDVPGTELCLGGRWSNGPCLGRDRKTAVLFDYDTDGVGANFGPLILRP